MASVDSPSATSNELTPENWADTTCRDLLAVQAQNRRLSPERRLEEVERHLREKVGGLAESQRRQFLRSLAARFPLPEHFPASVGSETKPQTPLDWVAAFESIKDGLTPELKEKLFEKLGAADCLPPPPSPVSGGIPMPTGVEPLLPKGASDPARVAQMLDVVLEATRALDGGFRRVWEGLADFGKTDHGLPRSSLDEVMRKFLMGDQDVPRVVLKARVETITKLIPMVLLSVKESWDVMEADVGNCRPEEVQKRVKKGTFGYEANCWKEFTKAAEKLDPDVRVQEYFEQIVTKARAHISRQ